VEADGDRVRARACLELGEEMADVRLDRLLGEEEPLADLAVHEAVGDQLEHLDLAGGRLLLQLLERSGERDHLGLVAVAGAAGGSLLEPARVVHVPRKDLFALCSVHAADIGRPNHPL
jgi:hypothetical protein